jgi:hypothetical protein
MGYSGARGKLINKKNLNSKISCQTPFNSRATNNRRYATRDARNSENTRNRRDVKWMLSLLSFIIFFCVEDAIIFHRVNAINLDLLDVIVF